MVLKNFVEAHNGQTFVESLRNDSIITTFNTQSERIMFGLWNWSPFFVNGTTTHFKDNLCDTLTVHNDSIGMGHDIVFHALSTNHMTFGPMSIGSALMACSCATVSLCEPVDIVHALRVFTLKTTGTLFVQNNLKVGYNTDANAFQDGIDLEVDRMDVNFVNTDDVVDVSLVHEPGTLTFDVNFTFTYDIFDMDVLDLEMNATLGVITMVVSGNASVDQDFTAQNLRCSSDVEVANCAIVHGHTQTHRVECETGQFDTLTGSIVNTRGGLDVSGTTKILGETRFNVAQNIAIGFNNNLTVNNVYALEHFSSRSLICAQDAQSSRDVTVEGNSTFSRDVDVQGILTCSQAQIDSCVIIGSSTCNNAHVNNSNVARFQASNNIVCDGDVAVADIIVSGGYTCNDSVVAQKILCNNLVRVQNTTHVSNIGHFQLGMSTYAQVDANTITVQNNVATTHPVHTQNFTCNAVSCTHDITFGGGMTGERVNVSGHVFVDNVSCNACTVVGQMACRPFACSGRASTQNIACSVGVQADTGSLESECTTRGNMIVKHSGVQATNLSSNVFFVNDVVCNDTLSGNTFACSSVQCTRLLGNVTSNTCTAPGCTVTSTVSSNGTFVVNGHSSFEHVRMNGGVVRGDLQASSVIQNANTRTTTLTCNTCTSKTASGVRSLTCPSLTLSNGQPAYLSVSGLCHAYNNAQVALMIAQSIYSVQDVAATQSRIKTFDTSGLCTVEQGTIYSLAPQVIHCPSSQLLSITTRRPINVTDLTVVSGLSDIAGRANNVSCESLVVQTGPFAVSGRAIMPTFVANSMHVHGAVTHSRQLNANTFTTSRGASSEECVARHMECRGLGTVQNLYTHTLSSQGQLQVRQKTSLGNLTAQQFDAMEDTMLLVRNNVHAHNVSVAHSSVNVTQNLTSASTDIAQNFSVISGKFTCNALTVEAMTSETMQCESSLRVFGTLNAATHVKVGNCATNSATIEGAFTCTSVASENLRVNGTMLCMGHGSIHNASTPSIALNVSGLDLATCNVHHSVCSHGSIGQMNCNQLHIGGSMDATGIHVQDLIVNNTNVAKYTVPTLYTPSLVKMCKIIRNNDTGCVKTEIVKVNASVPPSVVSSDIVVSRTLYNATFNGAAVSSIHEIFSLNPKRVVCDTTFTTFVGATSPRPNPEFEFVCEQIVDTDTGKILVKNMINPHLHKMLVGPRSTLYVQWPGDTPQLYLNLSWNAQKKYSCPFTTGAFYAWTVPVAGVLYGCDMYSSESESDDFKVFVTRRPSASVVTTLLPQSQVTYFHSVVPTYWSESFIVDNPDETEPSTHTSTQVFVCDTFNSVRINKMLTGAYVRFYASDGKWLHFSIDSFVTFSQGERFVQQLDVSNVIVDRDTDMLWGMCAPREDETFSPATVVLGAGSLVDLSKDGVDWLHLTESADLEYYGFYGKAKHFKLMSVAI